MVLTHLANVQSSTTQSNHGYCHLPNVPHRPLLVPYMRPGSVPPGVPVLALVSSTLTCLDGFSEMKGAPFLLEWSIKSRCPLAVARQA